VNSVLDESVALKEQNSNLTRQIVISESVSDLTETEIEKFKSVTEDVEFDNEDSFRAKLDTLKESYFPRVRQESTETIDNVETGPAQDIDVSDSMAVYMSAISRNVKGAK
jgi:predicted RNA-binding protein